MADPSRKKEPSHTAKHATAKETTTRQNSYIVTRKPSNLVYGRIYLSRRDDKLLVYLWVLEGLYFVLDKDPKIGRQLEKAWEAFSEVGTYRNEGARRECWKRIQKAMRRVNRLTKEKGR